MSFFPKEWPNQRFANRIAVLKTYPQYQGDSQMLVLLDNDKFALHNVDVKDLENTSYRLVPGTNYLTQDAPLLFFRDIGRITDPKQAFDQLMALRKAEIIKDGIQDDRRSAVRLQQQNDDAKIQAAAEFLANTATECISETCKATLKMAQTLMKGTTHAKTDGGRYRKHRTRRVRRGRSRK